jgi:serum/glucocorticoid-regulated kinase 2
MDGELTIPADKRKVNMQDFDLLKVLGRGSFGKVMMVRKKDTAEIFAMKVLKKEAIIARNQVQHTKTERNILKIIDHPNIVRLHYAFQNEGAPQFSIFF